MISIVLPVETMDQSSVQKGSCAHARSAHRRRRCRIDACTGPRFALVPLIVPTSTIGDRDTYNYGGTVLHFTRHAPCDRVTRPTPRHPACRSMHAIPPLCISRENEPRLHFQNSSSSRRVHMYIYIFIVNRNTTIFLNRGRN